MLRLTVKNLMHSVCLLSGVMKEEIRVFYVKNDREKPCESFLDLDASFYAWYVYTGNSNGLQVVDLSSHSFTVSNKAADKKKLLRKTE